MKPTDQPLWPLRVIHLDDGLVVELNDLDDAGTYLEFYDSDDPKDSEEVLVLDRAGRRVRIVVDMLEVKRLELYDAPPLSEEEISRIIEEGRRRYEEERKKYEEARQRSILWRFLKWFTGVLKGFLKWFTGAR